MSAMTAPLVVPIDPWRLEIIAVVGGSHSSADRMALSRDVQRGLLIRIRPGAYVEREAFLALSPEEQHIVRVRALAAVSSEQPIVSHWSAAVLHGLPVLRPRLTAVHVTVPSDDHRHRQGLVTHGFVVDDSEIVQRGELRVTALGRTIVDIAGAVPLEEGVIAVNGALVRGVRREYLEAAVEQAGQRRAAHRIADAIAIGHPGAESAAESRTYVSLMRSGFEVPVLQSPVRLSDGSTAWLDELLATAGVGIEVDGEQKYRDARMARSGAAQAVIEEKRREDELRLELRGLVRPGWVQSGSATAMRSLLARVGVHPTTPRTPFTEYCAAARVALPRRSFR